MQNTIYKYGVEIKDHFTIHIPEGAQILTVQTQQERPFIWAVVDLHAIPVPRTFRLVGTGHPVENSANLTYIGTFQMHDGGLVFHLFEEVS